MNILFFAGRIIYGGGEKVRNWLAKELVKNGHRVVYATPTIDENYLDALKKVELADVVDVTSYAFYLKKRNPFKYHMAVSRLYKDNQIELLIIFGGSLVEQIIARQQGIKILLSERCEPASRPLFSRLLKQIQFRVADGYVFQTPEASHCYGHRAHRLSVVIPNPIIDRIPEPCFDHLRKEIVTVGRLSPEKNQGLLIDAFAQFHHRYPDFELIIYGSGPLKDALIEQIQVLKLEDSVSIVSGKTNISELIRGASLFVLPSNTEGMPNALIEAMSVGLLCISTDCPIYGPRMLIKPGENGYLVPIKDRVALFNAMIEALADSTTSDLIRKNALGIIDTLDAEIISKKWITYINGLVD